MVDERRRDKNQICKWWKKSFSIVLFYYYYFEFFYLILCNDEVNMLWKMSK
jgi:hypothetical protein